MNLFNWIGQRFGLTGESARKFWGYVTGSNYSNELVTPDRAMTLSAYWRGVRLKAETIATLPPSIYLTDAKGDDAVKDRENQYDPLVRVSPNDSQTPVEFWEGMVASMTSLGNGYARKVRIGNRIVALEPLDACRTYPFRNSQGALRYNGYDWYGDSYSDMAPEEVYHLKGFSFGGDSGLSAVQYGAQSLGMVLAAQKVAGKTFASGLSSPGFLETGQILNDDDRPRLEEILRKYQSDDTPGKMMILEGGMKYNRLAMTSVDAELLATIGFGIEEVGRWLGMPPILLGHSSAGQTMWGTGVEGIIQAWYNLGLRADITRVEKSFLKRVIQVGDRSRYYLKISVDGLLRGDSQARALIAATLAQNGLRNRDELRALDEYPAIPNGAGRDFTAQTNLAPLGMLGHNGGPPLNPVDAAIRNMIAQALQNPDTLADLRASIARAQAAPPTIQ